MPAGRLIARLAFALVAFAAAGAGAAEYRTIGEQPAILYDAPSAKADRLFVASRHYPFEVLVKLDQWTKVRDVGGEVAWVENRMLGDRRTALVTVPLADVRASPSLQAPVTFEAYKQVLLEVMEPPAGDWVKVRHRDGQQGYIRVAHIWASERVNIAILGAGAWGSALATSFCTRHAVRLWTRDAADCESLARTRRSRYLPEVALPESIRIEPSLAAALRDAERVIVATATSGLRETLHAVAAIDATPRLAWACKGFERDTRRMPHEIVAEVLPRATQVGVLSGPSFALEVARGQPTAVVLASRDAAFASATAAALNSDRLRIYSSTDVPGVELGGAVKNVIAIAAGIADGLELGRNARAALVTRGLAEIVRLGVAAGGTRETFMGLTGLGDLVLTCTGDLSRNREVGVRLASGKPLEAILRELGHVAEGVQSASAVLALARERGIDMPITEGVCAVLFDGRAPADAVRQLLARDPKPE